ncbi:MAG: choline/ethanolamine kinase family protein [Pseudomonadales bacterium]
MAEKLSPESDRLTATLEHWQEWRCDISSRPTLARQLKGKSNDNYLVSTGSDRFVVRINNDNPDLGVKRHVEAEVLGDIAGQPYSPEVIWQNESSLVTRYIDGEHPEPSRPAQWLVGMGRLFLAIHNTPTRVTESLDPLNHAIDYFEQLDNPDPAITACMEQLLIRAPVQPAIPHLCHNDLLFENVILVHETFFAIDWEYSRCGDPAFDLAVFLETCDLSPANTATLLAAYDRPWVADRIDAYRELYRLIEILWWALRAPGDGENDTRIAALARKLGITL